MVDRKLKIAGVGLAVGLGLYLLMKSGTFRSSLPSPFDFIFPNEKPQSPFPEGDIRNELGVPQELPGTTRRIWVG